MFRNEPEGVVGSVQTLWEISEFIDHRRRCGCSSEPEVYCHISTPCPECDCCQLQYRLILFAEQNIKRINDLYGLYFKQFGVGNSLWYQQMKDLVEKQINDLGIPPEEIKGRWLETPREQREK